MLQNSSAAEEEQDQLWAWECRRKNHLQCSGHPERATADAVAAPQRYMVRLWKARCQCALLVTHPNEPAVEEVEVVEHDELRS